GPAAGHGKVRDRDSDGLAIALAAALIRQNRPPHLLPEAPRAVPEEGTLLQAFLIGWVQAFRHRAYSQDGAMVEPEGSKSGDGRRPCVLAKWHGPARQTGPG